MDKERLVRDIYHKGVIFCRPDTPLYELVRTVADTEIHAVMVAEREGEAPIGVVSHRRHRPLWAGPGSHPRP